MRSATPGVGTLKHKMRRLSMAGSAFALVGFAGSSCQRSATTYEDCVLESLSGSGKSAVEVKLIETTCRTKFPVPEAPEPNLVELDVFERAVLTGRAGPDPAGTFSGTLYNGNEGLVVRELTFSVRTTSGGNTSSSIYRVPVEIPPQSGATFSFIFVPGDYGADYAWEISAARGTRFDPNDKGPFERILESLGETPEPPK